MKQEAAISLGGNGYPLEYTAMTRYVRVPIIEGPPAAKAVWTYDAGDIITSEWAGKTVMDIPALEACDPDEWLLIQAWDES